MEKFCVSCKRKTEKLNFKLMKTKTNGSMVASNFFVCEHKKSKFVNLVLINQLIV